MFGLCSAPEKYNKIIRDVLKNCQGCANIADDVIVYGKTLAEHDKNLIAVLDTLRESGLTVNEKKCKFRLPKLTFFGHDLSRRGIEPSEEKIAAIQDCESPKTASEAKSFMGIVQYFAKFIPDLASIARPIQDLTRKQTLQYHKLRNQNLLNYLTSFKNTSCNKRNCNSVFVFAEIFQSCFAEMFCTLKHFVHCLKVLSKLAITLFISLYFQTF